MKMKKPKRALTTHQVADFCGCHFTSVIRWITQGKLKAYRTLGGHRRILVEDLREFMKTYGIPEPEEMRVNRPAEAPVEGAEDAAETPGRDGKQSSAAKRKVK